MSSSPFTPTSTQSPPRLSQGFLNPILDQPHLVGLLTHRSLGLSPHRFCVVWGETRVFVFLIEFQVMVMMLILGPYPESHFVSASVQSLGAQPWLHIGITWGA